MPKRGRPKGSRRPILFQRSKRLLSVMLDSNDYEALQQIALSLGLAASTFVRMLIKQQIHEHAAKQQLTQ
ncbi:MAG: hypothetical protein ABDH31_01600 [Chlorobiota bacterium]